MSWQDRDTLDLQITTGDGEKYTVSWLTASQKIKWHGNDQSYINLNDSQVTKKKRQGRIFPLEFFFQGDDHLEDSARFRSSLDDPNPCTIEHPYYNTIIAQILELEFDNSALNVTRCVCTAMETMVGESAVVDDRRDIVLLKKVELDDLIEQEPELVLSITEVDNLQETTQNVQKMGVKIINIPEEAEEYFNAFSTASSYINSFTASPLLAMQALNNFLTMPAQFSANVQNRIRILKEQFDLLRSNLVGVLRPSAKNLYTLQQSGILSAMCKAAVSPFDNEYRNALVSLRIADTIKEAYNEFLEDMDELQTSNNGSVLSFVPSFNVSTKLEEIIKATISGLYVIALNGRRERTFDLAEDTNIFVLTHMIYRMDAQDENINELIENNTITYKEVALGLNKGRRITYFI